MGLEEHFQYKVYIQLFMNKLFICRISTCWDATQWQLACMFNFNIFYFEYRRKGLSELIYGTFNC